MENPLEKLFLNSEHPKKGKMTFSDACAFYAALQPYRVSSTGELRKLPPAAVAQAAGVSQPAISNLAAAGNIVGGQTRYPKVALEYATLGHDAFVHKYLTPIIQEKLTVALDAYNRKKRDPLKGKLNIRAASYEGRRELKPRSTYNPMTWTILIAWRSEPAIGWHYQIQAPHRENTWRGAADGRGFATSQAAFHAAREYLTPKEI
jgi:hypothetical protein